MQKRENYLYARNPLGFDNVKGYDDIGAPHRNKITGESLMLHIHDKTAPGSVRIPDLWKIPKRRQENRYVKLVNDVV